MGSRLCERDRTARLSSGPCLLLWRSQSWFVTRNSCSKMIAPLRQHSKTGVEFESRVKRLGRRSKAFHTAATSRRSPKHAGCGALLQALSPVIPGRSGPLALMQALVQYRRTNVQTVLVVMVDRNDQPILAPCCEHGCQLIPDFKGYKVRFLEWYKKPIS